MFTDGIYAVKVDYLSKQKEIEYMKKILFFIPNLSVGGAEKVLVNLVNNMDRTKFDISVLSLFGRGVNEQFLKKDITYKYCFKKSFKGNSWILKLFRPKSLYKHFIKKHYDIVISYLEGPTSRIVAGCPDNDTKKICWIHCRFDSKKTAQVGFRNFYEAKALFNRFDYIACVSELVKNYFCQTMDYNGRIKVLYNTNETKQIYNNSLESVPDAFFDDSCFNLCSVGKIEPVKGFDRLARIHKRLLDDGIRHKFYILGDGSQKKEIVAYLKKNQLEESFILMGYHTNPYKYMSKCDLFVCSSLSEGFSTAATEALIVGTPVCTVEVSGMKEMLGNNNEYGVVTENSEEALYKGIKYLLENPETLAHYKHQAEIRGKDFSTKNTVKAVEELFSSI